jgi:hypothetical protein
VVIGKFYFCNAAHKLQILILKKVMNKIILLKVLTVKRLWVN